MPPSVDNCHLPPGGKRVTKILFDGDFGVDCTHPGERGETAIGAGDHPLAADDVGELADPLGDQFGMFDVVGHTVDDTGDQHIALNASP